MGLGSVLGLAAIVTACGGDDDTSPPASNDASTADQVSPSRDSSLADASTADQSSPPQDSSIADTSVVDAADAADAAMVCLGLTDAAGLDDAMVQEGHDLVVAFRCVGCHQSTPADAGIFLSGGDKFLDGAVFSANLTPDPVNGLGCWTDPQIVNAILNGFDDQDAALCVMPKFAARMDAGSALAVATFLRSLPANANEVPESMCPAIVDAGADADADAH